MKEWKGVLAAIEILVETNPIRFQKGENFSSIWTSPHCTTQALKTIILDWSDESLARFGRRNVFVQSRGGASSRRWDSRRSIQRPTINREAVDEQIRAGLNLTLPPTQSCPHPASLECQYKFSKHLRKPN